MPTPPNFKPNPLTPQYLWNERASQYSDRKTGRFVSRQAIRGQLDKVIDASGQVMKAVSQQLRDGDISLAEWQVQMMQQIKTTHLASAAMQRGGWQQMTQADFGRVGRTVRNEYAFLRDFAEQIASGEQKLDGTLARRAAQYGQQGRPTYYQFWDTTAATRGFDEERSVLNPAEHCQDCIDEAAKSWQPLGQMIPIGQRQCRSNDRCDKEYRNSETGEVVRV
jgi:hypothetical protein